MIRDPVAVAVLKHDVIVGHLPRKTAGVRPKLSVRVTRDRACGGKFSARLILRFDFCKLEKNSQFAIIRLSQLKPVIRYAICDSHVCVSVTAY